MDEKKLSQFWNEGKPKRTQIAFKLQLNELANFFGQFLKLIRKMMMIAIEIGIEERKNCIHIENHDFQRVKLWIMTMLNMYFLLPSKNVIYITHWLY